MWDAGGAPAAVEVSGVYKNFGKVSVLRDVSMRIERGSARALVGRNGAGKSTLVGVLTGLLAPTKGSVMFDGEVAPVLRTGGAWRAKVACVYQRSTLVPSLSVAENLYLNSHPGGGTYVDWASMRRKAQEIADEWGLEVDVDTDAGALRVEQRQVVEIARALVQGARFLILDEPTAALEFKEIGRLFERIRRLKDEGITLLYISHHLQEIYELCDSVSIMRDGRMVAEAKLAQMPKAEVVAAMVGAAGPTAGSAPIALPEEHNPERGVSINNLALNGVLESISLVIKPGESVGIAGLGSSGKEELGEFLAGLRMPDSGTVTVAGKDLSFGSVGNSFDAGVSYVPRDRRTRGILPQLSIAENLTVTVLERYTKLGFINEASRNREVDKMFADLGIVASSREQPVNELSGGNQQKVVVGRALASTPKLMVLVYPTQGVDVASKSALFEIVREAQLRGTCVMVISDEVDELRTCNRVIVLFKGRIAAELMAGWEDSRMISAIEGV
jgi:simple sugar transport system ATP-binding protein